MYEIERKFLVDNNKLPKEWDNEYDIRQAYLISNDKGVTRIRQKDNEYILTIKMRDSGIKQVEIEKDLTEEEFNLLWDKCDKKIVKTRKISGRWEVDFFHNLTDKYKDLIMAEIELSSEDEEVNIPEWADLEVTGYSSFFNNNLIDWAEK